jgi:hypothetical protein
MGGKNIDKQENYGDLSDHLYDLGLLEEEPDSANDTNIWDEPGKKINKHKWKPRKCTQPTHTYIHTYR